MLVRIKISRRLRFWVDMSFHYEKYADVNSPEKLSKYLLKYGHVNGVYTDEEVAQDLKRTVAAMLRDGVSPRQVVKEVSALYGIPEECVDEVVAAVPA